ncbi:MAG: bifunctional demethylmenaquinone methyltransferase/2-methoxy-6-polyprenyl-1,4-benzoquinol methylase UbiE [Candidatus Dadabacteria bacterium]|nr:bifunctional demethylmenaquinone methyltransferase/2-methoxy-6-polyprenyl-1,4-benzoquinol methylase UbiE [Candidatus Dadabacteria bacterium]NIQ15066.1 bifunctional demethylmenaquinone methyltransferase/2-methoxy-6-polyprenyl-1,4-benzoquinol methylase UbiE [Candidatus Dadabacteria bacterium]
MPETKKLFDKVAKNYDLVNTIISFGMHKSWRKKLALEIKEKPYVLDIATGTGDVAIEIATHNHLARIIGLDPSLNMLKLGNKKIKKYHLNKKIKLVSGIGEKLPFNNEEFNYASIAFGIRNTIDYERSLKEILRILRSNGRLLILEFAIPKNPIFKPVYLFYFNNVMPIIGKIFNREEEYKYLASSTINFPQRHRFLQKLKEAGFQNCKYSELNFGTVILYTATKY